MARYVSCRKVKHIHCVIRSAPNEIGYPNGQDKERKSANGDYGYGSVARSLADPSCFFRSSCLCLLVVAIIQTCGERTGCECRALPASLATAPSARISIPASSLIPRRRIDHPRRRRREHTPANRCWLCSGTPCSNPLGYSDCAWPLSRRGDEGEMRSTTPSTSGCLDVYLPYL
jgi:hypothetical protein